MKKSLILTGTILGSLFATSQAFAATTNYQVQSGDTLYKISQQYNTSVDSLKTLNNLNSNLILPGQTLKVNQQEDTYTVQAGDSLTAIANKFNTTTDALVKLNPSITNPNLIVVGQTLQLTGDVTSNLYTVQLGDTLSSIAKAHTTTVEFLLSLNPEITNSNLIRVGQAIKVSGTVVDVSKTTTAPSTSTSTATTTTNTSSQTQSSTPVPTTTVAPAPAPAQAPAPVQTQPVAQAPVSNASLADKVVATAQKYLGASYLYGASTSRTDAFDCSSLTLRVFQEGAGITLPRTSSAQSTVGTPVSLDALQKGDLVFFDPEFDGTISHVGIYVGNGEMISATTSHGVTYSNITSGYWKERLVKATRVL